MKLNEAQALMNPGLCPKCEKALTIDSKGFIFKSYSLKCSSCGSSWENTLNFLNDTEQASIEGLRKEGLAQWPYEVPIVLKSKEIPYLVRQGVGIYEGRKYTYRSSSAGMSLRLAPGVWVRSGSSGGQAESQDIMKMLDEGDITLTNRRLVFIGSKKNVEIPLGHILALDVKEDGLLYIARKNKARIEAFSMMLPNLMKEFITLAIQKNDE